MDDNSYEEGFDAASLQGSGHQQIHYDQNAQYQTQ